MKAARTWRREYGNVLAELRSEGHLTSGIAVYGGTERQRDRGLPVLPFADFTRELAAGRIL